MSETVSHGRGDGQQPSGLGVEAIRQASAQGQLAAAEPDGEGLAAERYRSGHLRWVVIGSVVVLLIGGAAAWAAGAFKSSSSSGNGQPAAAPVATATVARENVSETASENATLGYAGSYTVAGRGSGTLTWLPSGGSVITQGHVLYRTDNGTPTVLMYGSVPAWRSMSEGDTGSDVDQLNHDLVDLGYANRDDIETLGWDYYSWETLYAEEQLEKDLGVSSPSGSLSLGSVVFEPEALRVSTVPGSLGSSASGPILTATSDRQEVTISLSTSMESDVKPGDPVAVTLPNTSTTQGVITSVGTVASGSGSSATIPVYVKLTDPKAAANLDQAPLTVQITTASASNVLAVPVGALLAQSSGGYAVEAVGAAGTRHLVPVTVGLIDDVAGIAEVTGNLAPGDRVVVPSS